MTMNIGSRAYTVTKNTDPNLPAIGYYVTGDRGARYILARNQNDPHLLFPVCVGKGPRPLAGHNWFTDANGTLETYQ